MSAKATQRPATLTEKLLTIRRHIGEVERQHAGDGDDAFTYPPADRVFHAVKVQLNRRKVLALPVQSMLLAEAPAPTSSHGVTYSARGPARVKVTVLFVNVEATDETHRVEWIGEGDDAVKASTSALKGLFLATFLPETVQPPPADRHEAREREVKADRAITPTQRKRLVATAATDAGLSDAEVLSLATRLLGLDVELDSLERFPRDRVDDLLAAIQETGSK